MFYLVPFLPIIINIVLIGVVIYFLIKVMSYMNEKIELEKDRNEALNELIKVMSKDIIKDQT
ncbi:hypothetical protein J1TS3_38530 [Siminovitchia fordii]|uniref:ATP synthase F0 subunit 8 n=1 Tax=Siminovitchia fordii TaxID=254759 RepID=A0ABQ4KAG7_9BACI|nr:hypothetical protein J1TS3_38530 [Siminovitchia fordii]